MKRRNVRNQQVADVTGVHLKTVSQWLGNKFFPSGATLEALATFLEVTPSWLVYGDWQPPRAVTEVLLSRNERYLKDERPGSRRLSSLPQSAREYLAEFRLRLTQAGATEEQIEEAFDLFTSPEVFSFYIGGGVTQDFSELDILNNVKTFAEESIIPTLRRRGLKL